MSTLKGMRIGALILPSLKNNYLLSAATLQVMIRIKPWGIVYYNHKGIIREEYSLVHLGFYSTVDDINPALPIKRILPSFP